jgi:predicted dehydrogenase
LRTDVGAVTVCTPSGTHLEVVEVAAAAGKHIIVEKPLEVTHERVERLLAACRTAGVKLAGVFQHRFGQGVQKVHRAVQAGRLGRLILVDAYVKWYRSREYYD